MDHLDGLLPEIIDENDGDTIKDFNCNPGIGSSSSEHSIIMKLGDALQLCNGDTWNHGLIGQVIK